MRWFVRPNASDLRFHVSQLTPPRDGSLTHTGWRWSAVGESADELEAGPRVVDRADFDVYDPEGEG